MSDLIHCPKCGKETNKFSPACEYCSEPIPREISDISNKPADEAVKEEAASSAAVQNIKPDIRKPAKKSWKGNLAYFVLFALAVLAVSALMTMTLVYFGTFGSRTGPGAARRFSSINELSVELKRDPVKAAYVKDYISLGGIGTMDESDPGSITPKKYFYGTVRNAGTKLVIKLTATVYYYDKKGHCIAEGSVPVVLGTRAKPDSLKPDSSKDFQAPITNLNPEWAGRIRAKVSDIEFAD